MTDRLKQKRRFTTHVPQLVGRISYPQHQEDAQRLMRRVVSEFDTAMAELQGFLKYLQNSSDETVVAGAFYPDVPELVDGAAGAEGDPTVGWSPGDHKHQADIAAPGGLGNANAIGSGPQLPYYDHVHKRDVRVKVMGVDVATRNALDLRNGLITWGAADDPANDEVDITPSLSASAATISRGGTVLSPTVPRNIIVWRAPFSCTVLAVKGYRVGGGATGTFVNARRNGASNHLASNLELTSADTWLDGGSVQNASYVVGDKLELMLTALGAPFPSQVAIQIDFQRTA